MYNSVNIILIICTLIFPNNIYGTDAVVDEKKESPAYSGCSSFSTERVKFKRINSAQQEIDFYEAIYAESKDRNCWFSGLEPMVMFNKSSLNEEAIASIRKDYGSEPIFSTDHDIIQKKDIEYFQKKEELGFYKLPMSFADYMLLDKSNNELIGRLIFKDSVKEGRIEYGIYIFEKFRKKGLGLEITSGIFKNVIDPAIGQPFLISCYHAEVQPEKNPFETTIHSNFQGVFGTVAPWFNYPSVSISHKADCALRWKKHIPYTFYPIGNESSMNQSDMTCFKEVIKILFTLNEMWSKEEPEIKEKAGVIPAEKFFSIFKDVEEDSNEEDPLKENLRENLYSLLCTQDCDTFISTIEALTFMGESKKDLKEVLYPEHTKILLSKNKSSLLNKHKDLLEYLSKNEESSENTEEISFESNSENSEEDMNQVNKKRTLFSSDTEENGSRPTKRKKQEKK